MPRCNSAYFALGISDSFQRNKIGTQVTKKLVKAIFDSTAVHRLEAGAAVINVASNRVLEKCGFIKEGIQRKAIIVEGEPIDYVLWGILKEDLSNEA